MIQDLKPIILLNNGLKMW